MRVERLYLRDFRNYERADLSFGPSLNLILGVNGSGKTNLLEAIYVVAAATSHRTHRLPELIRWGEKQFHVKALTHRSHGHGDESLELIYRHDGRKAARRAGVPLERLHDLLGRLMVVIFSPDDLQLVKGGPAQRRDWLDGVLRQTRPAYAGWQSEYERALAQRNEALRGSDAALVAVWEEALARSGCRMTRTRRDFCAVARAEAKRLYRRMAEDGQDLTLTYKTGIGGGNETYEGNTLTEVIEGGENELYGYYRQVLRSTRAEDRERGYTLRGPHRDEVELVLAERPVRRFGSQGQQRSVVLALKLAELCHLETQTERRPVLLLDDVLSELDERRARALMEDLEGWQNGCQVLVTAAAEPRPHHVWEQAVRFRVTAGQAVRES